MRTDHDDYDAAPMDSTSHSSVPVAWTEEDLRRNPHHAPDKAARVRSMFAAIAPRYDLNNRVHSLGRDQAWRRKAVRMAGVNAGDSVLDVACGTGDLSIAFARGGATSVTGLDFTAEMLDIARRKSQREKFTAENAINFVQGDAMNLPFADASFDIVSIAFGIRNVSDPAQALREFRRVLRPRGGRLVVLEFSTPRNPLIRAFNSVYCRRIMPLTATLLACDRSGAYKYLPTSVATFYSTEEFISLLRACGFEHIESRPMTLGICTAYVAR